MRSRRVVRTSTITDPLELADPIELAVSHAVEFSVAGALELTRSDAFRITFPEPLFVAESIILAITGGDRVAAGAATP